MKAIRIHERGDIDKMRVEEIERPLAGRGQILIKVGVAGVNYADLGQRTGAYHHLSPLPLTLGFEAAGVIEEVGPEVTALRKGMRVVSLVEGGYAEYAVAEAMNVIPIPDNVSFAQAVVLPVQGQTAYLALEAAHLQKGERVLIHAAAGGVGSLAIQLAKLMGASMVIGTTTSPGKKEFIRTQGADAVVHTKEGNWVEQVMQTTRGQGVDVVLDPVGGEIGQQSFFCLANFGRMVVYGGLSGAPTPLVAQMLVPKCLSVTGYNTNIQSLADQMRASQQLLHYIGTGQLRITLDDTFPLTEAASAHKAIAESRTRGKVVLTV
jgi:NADPH:quinone reductase